MARKPMSEAAVKARAKKAKATRQAKMKEALEQLGFNTERKKLRKPRKPMTAKQKAAATERLAKARAARQVKNPEGSRPEEFNKYSPDHALSYEKTRDNLKYQKELLSSYRRLKDSKEAKDRDLYNITETYINQLQHYLNTGKYVSLFYGQQGNQKLRTVCVAMAYYNDGTPKRNVGTFYPDLGRVWTYDDAHPEGDMYDKPVKKRRKRKAIAG